MKRLIFSSFFAGLILFLTPCQWVHGAPIFTLVTNLTGIYIGSVAWGDYNGDGRLDVLLHGAPGTNAPSYLTETWSNSLSGFVKVAGPLVGELNAPASVAWGDFSKNGVNVQAVVGRYFGNEAGKTFSESVAVGNYNSNGNLEWATVGWGNSFGLTWEGRFSSGVAYGVYSFASVAWGDYDDDGFQDLLVAGLNGPLTRIYRNNGAGTFTQQNPGLPGVAYGSVAWGDYDNDGRLDILITGSTNSSLSGSIAKVWRNTGSGFTNINAGLPDVLRSSGVWGDYDGDGRLDILISGLPNGSAPTNAAITQLWRNTGTGFTNVNNTGLPAVSYSSMAWGDYDNDGRPDILLSGRDASGQLITQVLRNGYPQTNSLPTAPTGLAVALVSNIVTFSWNAASDLETPASALTYNMRLGTSPRGGNVLSSMSTSNGVRQVPQAGNKKQSLTSSMNLTNLSLGTSYYWGVQTVDSSFAGGPFTEGSFRLLQAAPVLVQVGVTNVTPGDANGNGVLDESEFATVLSNLNGNGIVTQTALNLVLSNYWSHSPFVAMTNTAGLGGSDVTFALSNSIAGSFTVEYSTNLSQTNWMPLGPAIPRYLFKDTNAPANPQRYYRLRWP